MCRICGTPGFAADPGPPEAITEELMRLAEPHFARRVGAVRRAIEAAADLDAAARALLELAARWTPDHLGTLLGRAMELAAWAGREEVFLDGDEVAGFATEVVGQTFQEQIDFLRQKRPKPTQAWTDAMQGDHDRAFVVAGATDIAMVEDFQAAILRAAETQDIKAFARDFDSIVERYGWSYNGGREWRIRTIFQTNMRTSAMAGRLRQMREVAESRPYWQYVHAETRVPLNPRPLHVLWDGMVLRHDDPWWDVYFPPNDWLCSCGVRSLSEADLRRLGKTGPDTAPPIVRKPYLHQGTGVEYQLPEGTGYGWDYMPGDKWERGLVPSEMIGASTGAPKGKRDVVGIDKAEPIEDLKAKARPFTAPVRPLGEAPTAYVADFLANFGMKLGDPARLWTDVAGHRLLISEDAFLERAADGQPPTLKLFKGSRAPHAGQLGETIADPDEIWLGVRSVLRPDLGDYEDYILTRRYIRADPDTGLFFSFDLGRTTWEPVTGFRPTRDFQKARPENAPAPTNWNYINNQRVGKLLWKRK